MSRFAIFAHFVLEEKKSDETKTSQKETDDSIQISECVRILTLGTVDIRGEIFGGRFCPFM